ncbi:MAG: hypothetical protein APR63_04500 [Desulfuromonas sp. SDB]|nr:MAG: hypothetical protein APR63_04500 [Desulfuromonas sp. SDB]
MSVFGNFIGILITLSIVSASLLPAQQLNNIDYIIEKAEGGDAYFQGVLGEKLRLGEGVEVDLEKAYYWIEKSAEQNNPIGLYNLGIMTLQGVVVDQDAVKAMEILSQAFPGLVELAQQGDIRAQAALYPLYFYGMGVEQDFEQARKWLEMSAEQGFNRSMLNMARSYFYGQGVEVDYVESLKWYQKLAEQGDSNSIFQIGTFYSQGLGVDEDYPRGVEIFRSVQRPYYELENSEMSDQHIILNLLPPRYQLAIEEGSCGEACLWSILHALGNEVTQIEINHAGGFPGRGLHTDELFLALDNYQAAYRDLSKSVLSSDSIDNLNRYREFLYRDIIDRVSKGIPVLLGVKIYPTQFEQWPLDHFILLVGYDQDNQQLIYNDFNNRNRINPEKLLNREQGYSLVNDFHWVFAIEFTDWTTP